MKPVDQTQFGKPDGNCFAACIATILELTIDEVPNYKCSTWWQKYLGWFYENNICWDICPIKGGEEYYIASGMASRGLRHSVVYSGDTMVHDPHPSRDGLMEVANFKLYFKITR